MLYFFATPASIQGGTQSVPVEHGLTALTSYFSASHIFKVAQTVEVVALAVEVYAELQAMSLESASGSTEVSNATD